MYNWKTLDFARPDDLPFKVWMEKDGSDAKIYVTCVGNHDKALEKKLGYTEGAIITVHLTEDVIDSLQRFVEKMTLFGVAVLYQRVQPVPKAPDTYSLGKLYKCSGSHYHCDFYDDGYCMSRKKCDRDCKTKTISVYIG